MKIDKDRIFTFAVKKAYNDAMMLQKLSINDINANKQTYNLK